MIRLQDVSYGPPGTIEALVRGESLMKIRLWIYPETLRLKTRV